MIYSAANDYRDYIAHYGVLGMKWGVRRYQNYDGSYTRKGVERYRKAEAEYKSAAERTKKAKKDYKSGAGSKLDVNFAKREQKTKKRELNKKYKQLKRDHLADQGKELYSRGKSITKNTKTRMIFNSVAYIAALSSKQLLTNSSKFVNTKYGAIHVSEIAPAAIVAGTGAVNLILSAKDDYEAKRLRAYYAH